MSPITSPPLYECLRSLRGLERDLKSLVALSRESYSPTEILNAVRHLEEETRLVFRYIEDELTHAPGGVYRTDLF